MLNPEDRFEDEPEWTQLKPFLPLCEVLEQEAISVVPKDASDRQGAIEAIVMTKEVEMSQRVLPVRSLIMIEGRRGVVLGYYYNHTVERQPENPALTDGSYASIRILFDGEEQPEIISLRHLNDLTQTTKAFMFFTLSGSPKGLYHKLCDRGDD